MLDSYWRRFTRYCFDKLRVALSVAVAVLDLRKEDLRSRKAYGEFFSLVFSDDQQIQRLFAFGLELYGFDALSASHEFTCYACDIQ